MATFCESLSRARLRLASGRRDPSIGDSTPPPLPLWARPLAGSQYQHRDRSRNPTLVSLVMVAEVPVDDLPQPGIVRVTGQHRPGGNPEPLRADIDLNVGFCFQILVPARAPGIATLRPHDQVGVTVAKIGDRRGSRLTGLRADRVQQQV